MHFLTSMPCLTLLLTIHITNSIHTHPILIKLTPPNHAPFPHHHTAHNNCPTHLSNLTRPRTCHVFLCAPLPRQWEAPPQPYRAVVHALHCCQHTTPQQRGQPTNTKYGNCLLTNKFVHVETKRFISNYHKINATTIFYF